MRPPAPKGPSRGTRPPFASGSIPPATRRRPAAPDQYESLRASLLYCPKCKQATPTRERLLLVLPTGNLYEYLCMECGTSTGSKTEQEQGGPRLFRS